jgi:hypothetical protein
MDRNIILRIDDIGRKSYPNIIQYMLTEFEKRKIPSVLGVIACELENPESYLYSLGPKWDIEFALHGYFHQKDPEGNPEFKLLSKDAAKELIQRGKKIMSEKLEEPITFIPPWNQASAETKQALQEIGFKVFSGDKDEFDRSPILSLGYNAATSTFQPHVLSPLEKVLQDCRMSLDQRGYCVVMIHPQDYLVDGPGDSHLPDIDENKYRQFILLLDSLQEMNADFTTFKDIQKRF